MTIKDRIVFLDAGTVNYGDVSFRELQALGAFEAYEQTSPSLIEKRLRDATAVITNKCQFDRPLLLRLKTVRCVHIAATGVNNIDLDAARERKIAVTNVRGYSTETVVQFTFAFILALAGNLLNLNQASHDGSWSRSPFFMLRSRWPIREIYGKKLGIIGYGAIGKRVSEIAKAFGMKVLISRIPARTYSKKEKMTRLSFNEVVRLSDVITIHAPLTPLTQGLISASVIRKIKKGAFLINMSRGGIVDEKALRSALESGHLGGAAADVLTEEPPPRNHVLLGAPNFLLTPHVAWASQEARARLIHEIALNIKAFQRGKRRNRVV